MTHIIKLQEPYCDAVLSGDKTFEVRYNDRGYQKGDYIVFKPMDGFVYHPHQIEYKKYVITYVHSGLGLEKDFIVFGIKEAEEE